MSLFHLKFRVTFSFCHSESHSQFQHLDPSFVLSSTFKAIMSLFRLTFRVAFSFQQSESHSQFQHPKPLLLLSFSVQSHHRFSVTTFRVILLSLTSRYVNSQFWRSEPPSSYSSTFKANIASQLRRLESSFIVWHSQPPYLLSLVFRVTIPSQFGIQSYHPIMIGYSLPTFQRSKPQFTIRNSESSFIPRVQSHHIFCLTFRSISQSVIQSHHFSLVRHSELHSQHLEFLVFRDVFLF